jgi:hypothetical protein
MLEFRIRPNGFNEIKKRLIVTMSALFGAVIFLIVLLPALLSDEPSRFDTLPYLLPLFLGVFAFSVVNGIKKQRLVFESFRLRVDDEKIVRESLHTPTLTIYRKDVKTITKSSNGSFTIQGNSKLNAIGVPAQIENVHLLETTLNQIIPVTVRTTKTFSERMFGPIALSGAGLMAVPIVSSNQTVVGISQVLVVLLLTVCLILIQQSRNVDRRTQRLSWVALIPIVAYATTIVSRWME